MHGQSIKVALFPNLQVFFSTCVAATPMLVAINQVLNAGGGKLHMEISICASLAEAGAGNYCHSLQRLKVYGHFKSVCVQRSERVMDSGRLIINLVK